MSLRVWLPLNGDLRQQGCSNSIPAFNSSNQSIVDGGKIGKCLKTTNTGNISLDYIPNINTSSVSFGGWFKFNKDEIKTILEAKTYTSSATTATGNLIGNDSYGGLGIIWTSNNMYNDSKVFSALHIFCAIRTSTTNQNTSSFSVSFDTWTHIYFVWNIETRILSLYKDGNLINSKTFVNFTDARVASLILNYGATYGGNGPSACIPFYVNDFRIYDHVLSAKEVKELSKGLVCHYKLDSNSIQSFNNCYNYPTFNTSNSSGGWNHWGGSGHKGTYGQNTDSQYIFKDGQTYSHWIQDDSGATNNYLLYQSPAFDGGYRSLQCILKESNSLPINENIIFPAWNGGTGTHPSNKWDSIQNLGNGFYLCKCEGFQQDGSNDLVGLYVKPPYRVYVSECYLENNKTVCSDTFYQSNIVYDCSGYCRNAIKYGNVITSNSTSRNSLSTEFPNNTSYISLTNFSPSDFANSYTFSWWGKYNYVTGKMMWGYQNGNRLNLFINGGYYYWNTGDSSQNPFGTISSQTYGDGKWHYFAITGDGTTTKLYIDGEFKSNSKTYKGITGTSLFFNGWDSGTNYKFNGSLSDFRIYATPLSADDIKELYQVGASIDKSGNMFAYEFKEV